MSVGVATWGGWDRVGGRGGLRGGGCGWHELGGWWG